MKKTKSQVTTSIEIKETIPKKKKRTKLVIIISGLSAVILIVASYVLYFYLYKIPHDEAVDNYNNAVNKFDTAVSALDERNNELDNSISALSSVIYADNVPIDEFLMAEADSVLADARNVIKDSAPSLPQIPNKTDEINAMTAKILDMIPEVEALGNYSGILELLSSTEIKYQTMIDQFCGCQAEVIWTGVDEETTVLRFAAKLSNTNPYTLRDVTTEWIAYDKNDVIVGSFDGAQADIPANGSIYYVGGAGGVNLSGVPVRVELKITNEGLLTNRAMPIITANNVQIEDNGFNWFTVSAECKTESKVNAVDLDGQIIIKDADGNIIDVDFWSADNLPDSIDANGKFMLSEDFFDLPAIPAEAEVYVYFIQE